MNLSSITLVCIDCLDPLRAINALERSQQGLSFGAIRLLTHHPISYPHAVRITPLLSIGEYSRFCVRDLQHFIDTPHCLIVQHDGWVLNPSAWDERWLAYDYVGCEAAWTEPGEAGKGGNGGFSLRSKRLLQAGAKLAGDPHPEDTFLSRDGRPQLEALGLSFAPRAVQRAFGVEKQDWRGSFGHHQANLIHWQGNHFPRIERTMHTTQRRIVQAMVAKHRRPDHRAVHDIGSFDVNGNHRADMIALGLSYTGYDIAPGPNVDAIVLPYDWANIPADSCDIVISGSCLEHVEAPWLWAQQLHRIMRPGGLVVIDTPFSMGEHRYPVDCFRFLPDGFRYLFTKWVTLSCLETGFTQDEGITDCYFVGLKP